MIWKEYDKIQMTLVDLLPGNITLHSLNVPEEESVNLYIYGSTDRSLILYFDKTYKLPLYSQRGLLEQILTDIRPLTEIWNSPLFIAMNENK